MADHMMFSNLEYIIQPFFSPINLILIVYCEISTLYHIDVVDIYYFTSSDELKDEVEGVVVFKEFDHMEYIVRLLTLMVHFDFSMDLNRIIL